MTRRSLLCAGALACALGTATSAQAVARLTNHGGPVLAPGAKVVFIFWGPTFSDAASADHAYATTLQAYRNLLGTTAEYNVLSQYCGSNGCLSLTNLGAGTPDELDPSPPPPKVTDALVQAEVQAYLAFHPFNANTVYEVVIPSTSYSSSGSTNSCGGPGFVAYCSYHSWIGSGTGAIKYSIQPYPSCSACKVSGFTSAQNEEVFVEHETADSVTDPTGTTWYDSAGLEVADKCSSPYLSGGFAYQRLWSNTVNGCL